jgi:cold shock CspA family protein
MKGIIKKLVPEKGYGFISIGGSNHRDEYFFHQDDFIGHWNDLVEDYHIMEKIEVEFLGGSTPKGLRASNVTRLDYPNQAAVEA